MSKTQAKYHHLIPQTYMSSWANGSGTLKVKFCQNPAKVVERNKGKIAGITDYHSIKAGMPLCTEKDTDIIFASVLSFTVELDGEIISGPITRNSAKLNIKYCDFDKWIITRSDGTSVKNMHIKSQIEKVKIKDIEENWSTKYENGWSEAVEKIKQTVCSTCDSEIQAFDKEYLTKFFTILDWRGFNSNQQFEETYQSLAKVFLEGIENETIPENKRILPFLKTPSDEMRHYVLLKFYRDFLNDTGVIYKDAMINLQHTSFHFLISDGPTMFLTSDTPAFLHEREDGKLVGLLPITPNILMAKGLCTDNPDKYYVTHIMDSEVQRYNDIICKNAKEFIILPNIS